MRLRHLNINHTHPAEIGLESLFENIRKFFLKKPETVIEAVKKEPTRNSYREHQEIAKFFNLLNSHPELSFKKETFESPFDYYGGLQVILDKNGIRPDLIPALEKQVVFLKQVVGRAKQLDENYTKLTVEVAQKANDATTEATLAQLWKIYENKLKHTPVSEFRNHQFFDLQGDKIIEVLDHGGHLKYNTNSQARIQRAKALAGTMVAPMTNAQLGEVVKIVAALLEVINNSLAVSQNVGTAQMTGKTWSDACDDEIAEAIQLESTLTIRPVRVMACFMTYMESYYLLQALCIWAKYSMSNEQLIGIDQEVRKK